VTHTGEGWRIDPAGRIDETTEHSHSTDYHSHMSPHTPSRPHPFKIAHFFPALLLVEEYTFFIISSLAQYSYRTERITINKTVFTAYLYTAKISAAYLFVPLLAPLNDFVQQFKVPTPRTPAVNLGLSIFPLFNRSIRKTPLRTGIADTPNEAGRDWYSMINGEQSVVPTDIYPRY
jgi:hypothetical protein